MKAKTITLADLQKRKGANPFSCLTAYDATTARIISEQGVEVLLVGDSLGMVIQGHDTTVPVCLDDMIYHTECVHRGNRGSLLMTDMPFACHHSPATAIEAATELMRAGAQCVKLEGGEWLGETVSQMRRCGIPVCAHLGLCPQSVHIYGGYKKQGVNADEVKRIYLDALALEEAGAVLLLLESIPGALSHQIRQKLKIPTIGIGAGYADGQVLVTQDVLGMTPEPPKFTKNFLKGKQGISEAIAAYRTAVSDGTFPEVDPRENIEGLEYLDALSK